MLTGHKDSLQNRAEAQPPIVLDFSLFVKSDTVIQNIDLGSFSFIFPRTLPGNTGQSQNQAFALRDLGDRQSAMKL